MARPPAALFALVLTAAALAAAQTPTAPGEDIAEKARRIHRESIVLDTHIDTTGRLMNADWSFFERHTPPDPSAPRGQRGGGQGQGQPRGNHVDYPRMREGGLNAAFFSIFISGNITGAEAVERAIRQIVTVRRLAETHPAEMALATTAAEVRSAHAAGKVVALMGMEGGHMIDESLPLLRAYAGLGVRYLTLSHTVNTTWSDSSGDKPAHNGLTPFGKDVVRELNRLGVMVDISHVADKTFWDAMEVSKAPLVASHSSCRALSGHPRNLTDEMLKALAAKGGVIQINYLDQYLDDSLYRAMEERRPKVEALRAELEQKYPGPENASTRQEKMRAFQAELPPLPKASWEKIVEHIDHAVKVAGADHVGLGSDFDGASMPVGMEDCTQLPRITEALLRRGYTEAQIKGILGENLLHLMERVERVAADLKPSAPAPASR
jgi:membrane dipeptidase